METTGGGTSLAINPLASTPQVEPSILLAEGSYWGLRPIALAFFNRIALFAQNTCRLELLLLDGSTQTCGEGPYPEATALLVQQTHQWHWRAGQVLAAAHDMAIGFFDKCQRGDRRSTLEQFLVRHVGSCSTSRTSDLRTTATQFGPFFATTWQSDESAKNYSGCNRNLHKRTEGKT